jgi:hypothetical protein
VGLRAQPDNDESVCTLQLVSQVPAVTPDYTTAICDCVWTVTLKCDQQPGSGLDCVFQLVEAQWWFDYNHDEWIVMPGVKSSGLKYLGCTQTTSLPWDTKWPIGHQALYRISIEVDSGGGQLLFGPYYSKRFGGL